MNCKHCEGSRDCRHCRGTGMAARGPYGIDITSCTRCKGTGKCEWCPRNIRKAVRAALAAVRKSGL